MLTIFIFHLEMRPQALLQDLEQGASSSLRTNSTRLKAAADLRAEKRALEQTISDQGAYYAAVAAHYEQVRRLRHDLDNHLYTIRILLDDGKTAEAAQYAAELSRTEQSALQAEVDDV